MQRGSLFLLENSLSESIDIQRKNSESTPCFNLFQCVSILVKVCQFIVCPSRQRKDLMLDQYADNPKISTIYVVRELLGFNSDYTGCRFGREQLRYLIASHECINKIKLKNTVITSKSDNLKIGVNCLANRLCLLNKIIPLSWLNDTIETSKVKCKKLLL